MIKYIYKNQKGAALLLEIIVVLGITTLLIAISVPSFLHYRPNLKLNATARTMVADFRYAQQLTITEQVIYEVWLDEINDSYSIIKTGLATSTIKKVDFPKEVSYNSITGFIDNKVIFNAYGGVSEAGDINLVNINNNFLEINVKPSGYVRLNK